MQLSDLAGNEELKYELSEAMSARSLPHAVIIEGEKGVGKRTLASILASYAVCTSEGVRPCGVCSGCVKAAKNIHPDIFTADGMNSGELNIESIRRIRSDAYIKPNEAPGKVYILLNCEKMLAAAQNAFLKVLEEPPENVMFIMTALSSANLLQTVRSRSRILTLYPPSVSEAAEVLKKLRPDVSQEIILQSAVDCGGNIGASLELIASGGEEEKKAAEEIFRAIPQTSEYDLMVASGKIAQNRAFAVAVLDRLCGLSSECVRASYGAADAGSTAKELAGKLSRKKLIKLQSTILHARDVLNINVNLNFYSTWLCAVLRSE